RIRLGGELPRHQLKLPPVVLGQNTLVTRKSTIPDGRESVANGWEAEQHTAQIDLLDPTQPEGQRAGLRVLQPRPRLGVNDRPVDVVEVQGRLDLERLGEIGWRELGCCEGHTCGIVY